RSLIVSTSMLYVIMSYPPCPTLFPYTTLFRSQDAQRAGVADHPGGEALRIAGLHHPGNHDRANRDDRGRRRTRDRGEQHAGEHRGNGQAATKVADTVDREADHPLGHAASGHERATEDEERDRQQREMLGGFVELERERREGIIAEHEDRQERRQPERDRDRHAHEEEQEQHDEQGRGGHRPFSADWVPIGPSSSTRSFSASSASSATRLALSPRITRSSTCVNRTNNSAKPIGMTRRGTHWGIGMSWARMPISYILLTYCQLPTNTIAV